MGPPGSGSRAYGTQVLRIFAGDMKRIVIENAMPAGTGVCFRKPADLTVEEGEQLAIIGPNASGKTTLTDIMTGRRPVCCGSVTVNGSIRSICFTDSYGAADSSYYYQQRWNHGDIDPDTPTVGNVLESLAGDGAVRKGRLEELLDSFGLKESLSQYVISLSSGELRKFQLIKILLSRTDILIIDNPFIGLDAPARQAFSLLLEKLSESMTIILVIAREEEVPRFITHVIRMDDMTPGEKTPWRSGVPEVLHFRNLTIRYGDRTIIRDLDWCVRKGEKWALTGENGSGKSLLLSLVCADNPMAYACDICLFGQRRGCGESIWEIKRRIGYVSPELHRSFKQVSTGMEIVNSGFHDTIGTVFRVDEGQKSTSLEWMETFGIAHLARKSFRQMSSGEQRLCLLARAFVKDPELLVLDEPMHGLDEPVRMKVRDIINAWASRPGKTLIMVTHYLEELPSCIDRRLVLVKNR